MIKAIAITNKISNYVNLFNLFPHHLKQCNGISHNPNMNAV